MARAEISRNDLAEFLASAVRRSAFRGIGDDLSVRVSSVTVSEWGVRIDFDNGDLVMLDPEHLVPRAVTEAPAAAVPA
jgi:hypothetical protein